MGILLLIIKKITHYFSYLKKLALIFLLSTLCLNSTFALELDTRILKQVTAKFGENATKRLLYWQKVIKDATDKTPLQQLEATNNLFNKVRFLSDQEHWQKEDYWATPLEMLVTNGGDCEDYSIAKYFTLRELGIPDEKLKITYVKAIQLNQAHMVLAYYPEPGKEPLILDNLINEILPASQRTDLIPVYSFNGEGLWLSKLSSQEGKRIGNASKLQSWQENMTRHYRLFD